MTDSKIPDFNTKEFYEWCVSKNMTTREISELENVTCGCVSKRMKKYGVLPSNPKEAIHSKLMETSESQGNMKTQTKPKRGGGSSKTQFTQTPQFSSADEPSSTPIQSLTPELIERAIIDNLSCPDVAKTQAINLAKGWLETKNKLNIEQKEDEEVSSRIKTMNSTTLLSVIKPIRSVSELSSSENSQDDCVEDN